MLPGITTWVGSSEKYFSENAKEFECRKNQLKIKRNIDFKNFILCPFTKDKYLFSLIEGGHIPLEDIKEKRLTDIKDEEIRRAITHRLHTALKIKSRPTHNPL